MTDRLDWFVNKNRPITSLQTGGLLQANGLANKNTAGSKKENYIFIPGKSLSLLIGSLYFFRVPAKIIPFTSHKKNPATEHVCLAWRDVCY